MQHATEIMASQVYEYNNTAENAHPTWIGTCPYDIGQNLRLAEKVGRKKQKK
jgi:hypothetical protein